MDSGKNLEEEKRLISPDDDDVAYIAQQADEIFTSNGSHWDTYFYKIVLAGNVKIIRQAVTHMESNGATKLLDWLFKRSAYEEVRYCRQKTSQRLRLLRVLLFACLTLVSVILTPLFYALHIVSATFLNRKQRRISANIGLPLAYAAFCQNPDMLVYFLSQGVDIEQVDKRGNNIFHYIADLSAVASEQAIHIFRNTVFKIDNVTCVKQLLETDRNSAGLTAVEYVAKFGSPSLLSHILQQPGIMHHTPFSASVDRVSFGKTNSPPESSARLELVDVTRYEAGAITDQSTLLNILSDRHVAAMSKADLAIFTDTHFIGTWLILKCKQMLHGILLFQICDFILTCLMVYVLTRLFIGERGVAFQGWIMSRVRQAQIDELEAWANNSSSVFAQKAFDRILQSRQTEAYKRWVETMFVSDPYSLQQLLNATSLSSVITAYPDEPPSGWDFNSTLLQHADWDKVSRHAIAMPEFKDQVTNLRLIQLYQRLNAQIAKDLLEMKSDLFKGLNNLYTKIATIKAVIQAVSIQDENGAILNFTHEYSQSLFDFHADDMCASNIAFEPEDIINADSTPLDLEPFSGFEEMDACIYKVFSNATSKTCQDAWSIFDYRQREKHAKPSDAPRIILFYVVCTYLYILIDVIERCVFLTNSVVKQTSLVDIVCTALGQKVPGSYIRKQLNVLSCLVIVIQYHFHLYVIEKTATYRPEFDYDELHAKRNYMEMLFITAIVVRFLMHIHALRLLPTIGHFIITTFTMGTNLLHFSAVFGTVLFIFAMLFHILINDPDCPLDKSAGFGTLTESIFTTFQLTFGHGDLDPFFSSGPVQLTYVLYVIIVGLLLLNLIIAIMSTTAMDIMAEPWKQVLWKVEWLDEATSVEYTFSILTLPFRRLRYRPYISHKNAGYVVKQQPNHEHKIYVQCFHCKALQDQFDE